LQVAQNQGRINTEQYQRALAAFSLQQLEVTTALRERLGIANETEITLTKLARVEFELSKGVITSTEAERARAKAVEDSRKAYEAMLVAASRTPELTRFALDAANGLKQFEQLAISTFGNFENAIADVATSTSSLSDAFKKMADSIIRDLIRITVRMSVTGPLSSFLSGLFGTPTGGFGAPGAGGIGHAQSGGPVIGGRPYVVGEAGPELFVPGSSGRIIPNQPSAGMVSAGLKVVVNNYTSNDTQTTQERRQGLDGEQLIIGIVKKQMASGEFDGVQRARFGLRAQKVR